MADSWSIARTEAVSRACETLVHLGYEAPEAQRLVIEATRAGMDPEKFARLKVEGIPRPPVVSPDARFWWDGQQWVPFGASPSRGFARARHLLARGADAARHRPILATALGCLALLLLACVLISGGASLISVVVFVGMLGAAVYFGFRRSGSTSPDVRRDPDDAWSGDPS